MSAMDTGLPTKAGDRDHRPREPLLSPHPCLQLPESSGRSSSWSLCEESSPDGSGAHPSLSQQTLLQDRRPGCSPFLALRSSGVRSQQAGRAPSSGLCLLLVQPCAGLGQGAKSPEIRSRGTALSPAPPSTACSHCFSSVSLWPGGWLGSQVAGPALRAQFRGGPKPMLPHTRES